MVREVVYSGNRKGIGRRPVDTSQGKACTTKGRSDPRCKMTEKRRIPPSIQKALPELMGLERVERVELLARKLPLVLHAALGVQTHGL